MNVEYLNEFEKKYMMITHKDPKMFSFTDKMLVNAKIPTTINPELRFLNGTTYFYYDITSKQSLYNMFIDQELIKDELITLLSQISKILEILSVYLLNINILSLNPQFIFYDSLCNTIEFCLFPNNIEENVNSFSILAEFIINHVTPDDDNALNLAYKYFENVNNGIFDPKELLPTVAVDSKKLIQITTTTDDYVKQEDDFYFIEPEQANLTKTETNLFLPLIICCGIILISGLIYALIFIHPEFLINFGISQENYMVIGAGLAFIISIILFFVLKLFTVKENKNNEKIIAEEELLLKNSMRPGKMEYMEYEMRQNMNTNN